MENNLTPEEIEKLFLIQNTANAARSKFKQNVNSLANNLYGTNANLNQRTQNIGDLAEDEYNDALMNIMTNRTSKNSFKQSAVQQIRNSLTNSALAENARLYQESKTVLSSEPQKHRQTVLKLAALDDIMAEEKSRLVLANTNEKAMNAATKLYEINRLKDELDDARHSNKLPSPDQEARYALLVNGVNFNAKNTSLYRRLRKNNANQTYKNTAATKIQKTTRGLLGRKRVGTLRARRNLLRQAALLPNNVAMQRGRVLGNTRAPLTRNQLRQARLAAFNRKK